MTPETITYVKLPVDEHSGHLAVLRHALDPNHPLPSRSDLTAAIRLIGDVRAWDAEIAQAFRNYLIQGGTP